MDALDQHIKEYGDEITELLLPANLMDCFESFRRKRVREEALPFHENELSWFLHLMNEFRGADDQKEDLTLLFDPMMYTVDHPSWSASPGVRINLPVLNSALYESLEVTTAFRRIADAEVVALRALAETYPDEPITGLARIAAAALADNKTHLEDRKSAIRYLAINASARLEDYWAADDSLWKHAGERTVVMPDMVANIKDLIMKNGTGVSGILERDLVCYSEDEIKVFAFQANRFLLSGKTKHLVLCGRCQERILEWVEVARRAEELALSAENGSFPQA